jgi:hypothetical protein
VPLAAKPFISLLTQQLCSPERLVLTIDGVWQEELMECLRLMPSLMHIELKAGSGMAVMNKLLLEVMLLSMPQQDWQPANYLVPKLEVISLCPNHRTSDDVLADIVESRRLTAGTQSDMLG